MTHIKPMIVIAITRPYKHPRSMAVSVNGRGATLDSYSDGLEVWRAECQFGDEPPRVEIEPDFEGAIRAYREIEIELVNK